jgi:hypothetical protein
MREEGRWGGNEKGSEGDRENMSGGIRGKDE